MNCCWDNKSITLSCVVQLATISSMILILHRGTLVVRSLCSWQDSVSISDQIACLRFLPWFSSHNANRSLNNAKKILSKTFLHSGYAKLKLRGSSSLCKQNHNCIITIYTALSQWSPIYCIQYTALSQWSLKVDEIKLSD